MQIKLQDIDLQLGGKQVFRQLNLEVSTGEKVLIRGPSGSGKSTLLRLILGFQQPDEGAVWVGGAVLSSKNVWALRRRMAFVPQELSMGFGQVSGLFRDVLGFRANRHLTYREEQVLAYFETFGLEQAKLEQDIRQLSGGEKQRVALILALLLDRELYLLDEVTSAIDAALRNSVIDYLVRLEGKSLIVVSHDPGWEAFGFREIKLRD